MTITHKIQTIEIQESRYTFHGITSNLLIMRRAYVVLIVLSIVIFMAWYKILCNKLSWYIMEYFTYHS